VGSLEGGIFLGGSFEFFIERVEWASEFCDFLVGAAAEVSEDIFVFGVGGEVGEFEWVVL